MATYTHTVDNFASTQTDLVLDEVPIYVSSRLGEWKPNLEIGLLSKITATFALSRGEKAYELSNHLGNVLAVVSDNGELLSAQDYYAFGMEMVGRTYSNGSVYLYGFNGKENDREWGASLIQDYGMRLYNPALCKFLSVDPLGDAFPFYTPYQFAGNKPIGAIDLDGGEEKWVVFQERETLFGYGANDIFGRQTMIRINKDVVLKDFAGNRFAATHVTILDPKGKVKSEWTMIEALNGYVKSRKHFYSYNTRPSFLY